MPMGGCSPDQIVDLYVLNDKVGDSVDNHEEIEGSTGRCVAEREAVVICMESCESEDGS